MATDYATDDCPLNDFGHKYFVAYSKPVYEYELFTPDVDNIANYLDAVAPNNLYKRTEYAYLSCWCGSSIKSPVKS